MIQDEVSVESLNPCVLSGIRFCIVGVHGHTESLQPDTSKAKWNKMLC